ncbi:hypothetical protein [Clostridium sp. B9]|uniref:hypothetical protein n=1 Tax=Clostridium sp. B9 TaxID=3423224 RepID=UPI003D2ED92E
MFFNIILVFGLIILLIGLDVIINKKFKLGYYLFYLRNIENPDNKDDVVNKDEMSKIIGRTFLVIGVFLILTAIIFFIFKLPDKYLLAPLIICIIYYCFEYFKINSKIS